MATVRSKWGAVHAAIAVSSVASAALAGSLGDVTIATNLDVTTLDNSNYVTGYHRWVYRNMNDPLITAKRDGTLKAALAQADKMRRKA